MSSGRSRHAKPDAGPYRQRTVETARVLFWKRSVYCIPDELGPLPSPIRSSRSEAYGGPASYLSAWMRHAQHADDRIFRLYASLFLLDFMSEHGQAFNGNQPASTAQARAALHRAFESNLPSRVHSPAALPADRSRLLRTVGRFRAKSDAG